MSIPGPLIVGSIAYLVLGCVVNGGIFASMATGMVSKDNASIGNVVTSVCIFSMWLFWLSAWLHQWHPLIKPIYEE